MYFCGKFVETYVMKNIYSLVAALCAVLICVSSCLKDDKVATAPECAVMSFSVGDIKSPVVVKRVGMSDTTIIRTIAGTSIRFNIDQIKGTIYTVDSLPRWADLKKVVPTFSCYGRLFVKADTLDLYYQMTSGSDSLDLSKPKELLAVATDGISSKKYTLTMYQNTTDVDTIVWNKAEGCAPVIKGVGKSFYYDGRVYLFHANEAGVSTVSSTTVSTHGKAWSDPVSLASSGVALDFESVLMAENRFYALGADGLVYMSDTDSKATEWTCVSEVKVQALLAVDACYIYAFDGTNIVYNDGESEAWMVDTDIDVESLPVGRIYSYNHVSRTNPNVFVATMTGHDGQTGRAVSWYKITSADPDINQSWKYIQVTPDNGYPFPQVEQLSAIYLDGALYVMGVETNGNGEKIYRGFYRSDDNGITWHILKEKYFVPSGLTPQQGATTMVAADSELWLLQEGRTVWYGTIR